MMFLLKVPNKFASKFSTSSKKKKKATVHMAILIVQVYKSHIKWGRGEMHGLWDTIFHNFDVLPHIWFYLSLTTNQSGWHCHPHGQVRDYGWEQLSVTCSATELASFRSLELESSDLYISGRDRDGENHIAVSTSMNWKTVSPWSLDF